MWWFRGCRDRGILGVCWPASIDNQFTPASVRDLAPKQVTSGLHMSEYTCMCAFTYVYVHTRGGVRVRAVRFLFLDYKSISLHFLLEVLKLHVLHLGLQTLYKNEFHQHYKLKKSVFSSLQVNSKSLYMHHDDIIVIALAGVWNLGTQKILMLFGDCQQSILQYDLFGIEV